MTAHVRLYTALLYSAVSRQFSATTDRQLSDGFNTPSKNKGYFIQLASCQSSRFVVTSGSVYFKK
jgi:hypothetical protein